MKAPADRSAKQTYRIPPLLLLLLLLLAPRAFKASALPQDIDGATAPQSSVPRGVDGSSEGDDDIFSTSYERELLARRFFQKTLPPLSPREKIVWSFRTSRANALL
ncbi:MAG: hypothetical protein JXO51_02825 [Candidatus Aminicenantes bacterium]|nr:hypothetical protein [Candidatus Aminicenantes bacterium]